MKRVMVQVGYAFAVLCGLLAVICGGEVHAEPTHLMATVIDRYGNQHQVERFAYQGRQEIEVYIGDQRRIMPFPLIDRIRFDGEHGDEEQVVSISMRSGKLQSGTMRGGGAAPHPDAVGGGSSGRRFTGATKLGPFFILVNDVREIILRHPAGEGVPQEQILKATIITLEGKRFEVVDLRFRGKQRLDFFRGRNKRFIPLGKVEKIDFDDSGAAEEYRPMTATYWNGRTVMGTVDASTVRLSGETDKSYYERVNAALIGRTRSGLFSMGMHHIKQIRFHVEKEGEEPAEK
ncbi:MAG: hypothetical protein ACI8PG_004769 [Planctomycetota bacterium]|jgi:hypothetical protein